MLVRQRGPSDCGVAAIAMFTGRPYEEVETAARATGAFHPRKGMTNCGRVLERLGFHWENLGRHADHPAPNPDGRQFRSLRFSWTAVKPSFIAQFFWGRPTLLSIVSLNQAPHGRHLVFFDGRRVLDPQEGRRGKRFATSLDDVEVEEAWVWMHDQGETECLG